MTGDVVFVEPLADRVMMQALKNIVKSAGVTRERVAAARMLCERRGLAALGPRRERQGGRILCYHSVGQPLFGTNDVPPARFRRHIEFAQDLGYRFVPPAEIARTGGGPRDLAITFDDALTTVKTEAAPILREHGVPYSVFVVSEWSDHKADWAKEHVLGWAALEELLGEGAEIGSHSATHCDFGTVATSEMEGELAGSRSTIEARLGFAPETFAIPLGQSANWTHAAHEVARAAGYATIYAQAEETRPEGTIARTFVTAFDDDQIFRALLDGAFDRWEEWTWGY